MTLAELTTVTASLAYKVDGRIVSGSLVDEIIPIVKLFLTGDPRRGKVVREEDVHAWTEEILAELHATKGTPYSLLEQLENSKFDLEERGILCEIIQKRICKSRTNIAVLVRNQIQDFLSAGSPTPATPVAAEVEWWEEQFWKIVRLDAADSEKQDPPGEHASLHYAMGYYSHCLEQLFMRVKRGDYIGR